MNKDSEQFGLKKQALTPLMVSIFIAATTLTFVPAAMAFTLSSGAASDLCTGPKYTGQTELIGRFRKNFVVFGNHQQYEFVPVTGEADKLPLNDAFPTLNSIISVNISNDQAALLPTDRVFEMMVNNYQAFCEGLPMTDFVGVDNNLKNNENGFTLVEGSSVAGYLDDVLYRAEKVLQGTLRFRYDTTTKTNEYFLEMDATQLQQLPLQDWGKANANFNSTVKIINKKLSWLSQNIDKPVSILVDEYGLTQDETAYIRIKTNFLDVDIKNPFADAIQFLKSNDMVDGYADGTFKSDANINRAEFTKMALLSRMDAGSIGNMQNCFPDVGLTKNNWFAPYVCALKDGKAIQGYADNLFHPEKNITIAEASKILMKMFGIEYNQTTLWTDGIMAKAKEKNLLTFQVDDPNVAITRGQVAAILMQLVKLK